MVVICCFVGQRGISSAGQRDIASAIPKRNKSDDTFSEYIFLLGRPVFLRRRARRSHGSYYILLKLTCSVRG